MKAIEISNIIAFLRGELPEKKQKQIQQKIEQDAHYAQVVGEYRKIIDGFNYIKDEQQQLYAFKTMEIDLLETGETKEILEVELIEDYLNGFLNEPALTWFEKRMTNEPTFKAKVADYKTLFSGLEKAKEEQTLATFEALEQAIQKETTSKASVSTPQTPIIQEPSSVKVRSLGSWVKWAAAVAVGVFFLAYSGIQIANHGNQIYADAGIDLSDTYLAPSDNMSPSDINDNLEKMKTLAISIDKQIEAKNYEKALVEVEQYDDLLNKSQHPITEKEVQELNSKLNINKIILYEQLGKKTQLNEELKTLNNKALAKKITSPWRTIARLLGI